MRKYILVVLSLVLVLCLSGCSAFMLRSTGIEASIPNPESGLNLDSLFGSNAEAENAPLAPENATQAPADEVEAVEEPETDTALLPLPDDGMDFYFSSGAGGWGTSMNLCPDGTFRGAFHDSDMGDRGDSYPDGTIYVSEFEGRFSKIEQINDYTYVMVLDYVETSRPLGETWIEDGIRYISCEPYGIDGGIAFTFYLPEAPLSELSEDFLLFWPYYFRESASSMTQLSCYGIWNMETDSGFFAIP